MNNMLSITEYNLLDYSLRLQEAFEKGYRISDSVNDSPMKIGNAYTVTVVNRKNEYKEREESEQAKIDADMLENNQEAMTEEQANNLAEKQIPFVNSNIEQVIEAALVVAEKVAEEQLELPLEVIPVENTLTEMLQAADEQCEKVEAIVKDIVSKAPSKRGRK